MIGQETDSLHELLRYHAGVLGSARLTTLGLEALIRAFEQVKSSPEEIEWLFQEALDAIRDTRPKLIALIDLLMEFQEELSHHLESGDFEEVRAHAIRILKEKKALYEEKASAVTRHGLEHVEDGDTILIHSASSVVTNILIEATQARKRVFQVLVLQLDPVRTPQVTRSLEQARIPHFVFPVHDLCHHQDEVDKLFIGALTITPDRKIVAPVGTASVLGLCHLAGIRSYLFANTLHYSRGLAHTQQIHRSHAELPEASTSVPVMTHSHDLVDLNLIDVIINEYGITSFGRRRD